MKLPLAIASYCACALAHAASGALQGHVSSNLGPPVTSGTIQITANGAAVAPASIDAMGNYSTFVTWVGTAAASCHLQTRTAGYIDQASDVIVAAGGTVTTDFVLIEDIFRDGFEPP